MRNFNKKLVVAAAAGGLLAVIGVASAQAPIDPDPNSTPMTAADASPGNHILHFADQGNSPETDPSAHLILIKDPVRAPVVSQAPVESTVVAQAEPTPAPTYTAPAPAATDSSSSMSSDTSSAPANDSTTMPAPRADRN